MGRRGREGEIGGDRSLTRSFDLITHTLSLHLFKAISEGENEGESVMNYALRMGHCEMSKEGDRLKEKKERERNVHLRRKKKTH